MKNSKALKQYYVASVLSGLCVLRIGSLLGVSALSTLRKAITNYPSCFQLEGAASDWVNPERQLSHYLDTLSGCVENSWQDYRNNLQILLLTQDEMLIWAAKIEKMLTASDNA